MQETGVQALGWEDPWRRKWQPTPVLLPGQSHGQRSLVGYSPEGCKRVRHNRVIFTHSFTQSPQLLLSPLLILVPGEGHGNPLQYSCLKNPGWGSGQDSTFTSECPGDLSESESRSVVFDCLRPHGLYSPWNSPGQNTGVGSLSLLQGIFPTQELNPGLLHSGGFFTS